jgi:TonB family protein
MALLLSIVVHTVLIFGVRGQLMADAAYPYSRIIAARLMGQKPITEKTTTAIENASDLAQGAAPRPAREHSPAAKPRRLPPTAQTAKALPAALPLPFDPVFYTWREVDVTARPQGNVHPPYPREALLEGISGQVLIEVWLDETGKVDKLNVMEADPPGYFEETTLAHYRALHFAPAMKDGKPRRFRARYLVEFSEPARKAGPN